MKPTVGRIVHFTPPDRSGDLGPYAAIVTKVHTETCIDLATLGSQSLYFQQSVCVDQKDGRGGWSWPPRE